MIDISSAIEAILFAAGESVPAARLSLVLDTDEKEILRVAEELFGKIQPGATGHAYSPPWG